MKKIIIFASQNEHKYREIQELLGTNFDLLQLKDLGFKDDIPEDQFTLEGNALQKARTINNQFHLPCFADDTGLEVEALHGAPGVYSARYAGSIADFGTEAKRTEANIQKLLSNLSGETNRKARFRTVIAYVIDNQEFLFEGSVEGNIIEQKIGTYGFGYDPVFVPSGFETTFAEMSSSEKNTISHRAIAFSNFVKFIKSGEAGSNTLKIHT